MLDLHYPNKRSKEQILNDTQPVRLRTISGNGDNKLIKGDNLPVLKTLLSDWGLREKIDLVYIDPPFATNTCFKIDAEWARTISHSRNATIAYSDTLVGYKYLEFLRERLFLIKELLSENGSIYVHIDYKIGHYVKIIMDEVFGRENFRNDITRIKCNPKNFTRRAYGNVKDMILFYSKSSRPIWNDPKQPLSHSDIERLFKKMDKHGRRYTTIPLHAPGETANGQTGQTWQGQKPPPGRHWRTAPATLDQWDQAGLIERSKTGNPRKIIFADTRVGKKKQDIWEYKDTQIPLYPTEKNINLLKSIISASSHSNSIVLDCFCGSGTTLQASQELGRCWIGIDQSSEAIKVAQNKIKSLSNSLLSGKCVFQYLES